MIVYIDMDDVLCDFSGQMARNIERNPGIKFPQSQYGFYTGLTPIDGAVSSVITLLSSSRYEPYILTAPSLQNPLCYTEKRVWVEDQLGMEMVSRLIISPNKSLLRGEYLIDDASTGRFQEKFEGELIQFGTAQYSNWDAVIDYLDP